MVSAMQWKGIDPGTSFMLGMQQTLVPTMQRSWAQADAGRAQSAAMAHAEAQRRAQQEFQQRLAQQQAQWHLTSGLTLEGERAKNANFRTGVEGLTRAYPRAAGRFLPFSDPEALRAALPGILEEQTRLDAEEQGRKRTEAEAEIAGRIRVAGSAEAGRRRTALVGQHQRGLGPAMWTAAEEARKTGVAFDPSTDPRFAEAWKAGVRAAPAPPSSSSRTDPAWHVGLARMKANQATLARELATDIKENRSTEAAELLRLYNETTADVQAGRPFGMSRLHRMGDLYLQVRPQLGSADAAKRSLFGETEGPNADFFVPRDLLDVNR